MPSCFNISLLYQDSSSRPAKELQTAASFVDNPSNWGGNCNNNACDVFVDSLDGSKMFFSVMKVPTTTVMMEYVQSIDAKVMFK